LANLGLQ